MPIKIGHVRLYNKYEVSVRTFNRRAHSLTHTDGAIRATNIFLIYMLIDHSISFQITNFFSRIIYLLFVLSVSFLLPFRPIRQF